MSYIIRGDVYSGRDGERVRRRRGVRVAARARRPVHVRGPARAAGGGPRARRPARQALL